MNPIDLTRWKDERDFHSLDPLLQNPHWLELAQWWRDVSRLAKARQLKLPFEDIQPPLIGLLVLTPRPTPDRGGGCHRYQVT